MTSAIQMALIQAETTDPYVQKPLSQILDDVVAVLQRFIVLPSYKNEDIPHGFIVLALWIAHAHTFMHVETTPYLQIWSAAMRSGKTTVLELLNELTRNPWLFSDVTLAALTRKIDRDSPTILYDEGDAANKELAQELGGIFNSGYKASGKRTVATGTSANITTIDLNVYCPKAFAGIGSGTLRETLRDRAIPIELRRKTPGEIVERNRARTRVQACAPIKQQLEGWASDDSIIPHVTKMVDGIPDQLDDRQQDCWEPLLAIADLASGEWPQRARRAALSINSNRELLTSHAEMLLGDIRDVFMKTQVTTMFTTTLLSHLHDIEERPWGGIMRGNPMNANSLAGRLRDFKVRPTTIRHGEVSLKGYKWEDFAEAFERNLPAWVEPVTSVAPVTPEAEPTPSVTPVTDVTDDSPHQAELLLSLPF